MLPVKLLKHSISLKTTLLGQHTSRARLDQNLRILQDLGKYESIRQLGVRFEFDWPLSAAVDRGGLSQRILCHRERLKLR